VAKLNQKRVGSAMGAFMFCIHFAWIILVILGWAQYLLDKIFSIHFISNPYHITGFRIDKAIVLLIFVWLIGYAFGYLFAAVWNWLHRKE
jgi:ABC-type multidrug transport system permease subunit